MLGSEAFVDEVDDLVSPCRIEVDVDVGHLAPLRIQEPLEEQVVGNGVGVGDAECVAHDRVARAPPSRVTDAARACEVDDLLHDEKVLREPHPLDEREFVLETFERVGHHRPIATLETVPRLFGEYRVRGLASRDIGRWEMELAQAEVEIAARRDLERCVTCSRQGGKQAAHLGASLEPELGIRAVVRTRERHASACRGEHVVKAEVLGAQVVHVVRGHDGQCEVVGEAGKAVYEPGRVRSEGVGELDTKVAGLKTARKAAQSLASPARRACEQRIRSLSVRATRQADESLGVLGEVVQAHD